MMPQRIMDHSAAGGARHLEGHSELNSSDPENAFGPLASVEDSELLRRFETQYIRRDEWTHTEHCRVAYLLIQKHDWAGAVHCMRECIIKLNNAQGVPNSDTRGYHETVTIAWLRLIAAAMERNTVTRSSQEFLQSNPHLLDKTTLAQYFSQHLLSSVLARQFFVHPDLIPLP